ncbi:MAG: fibronectin type III domain-containing protein [Candidatus Margulisbacteria bacterium]|jgi:hypothetical protein|nr:fibronectin type III domain-containing protein [Candidatus Margulisiibacteriota bacterium]
MYKKYISVRDRARLTGGQSGSGHPVLSKLLAVMLGLAALGLASGCVNPTMELESSAKIPGGETDTSEDKTTNPPLVEKVTGMDQKLLVEWSRVYRKGDNNIDIEADSYEVWYGTDENSRKKWEGEIDIESRTATITGLDNGVPYLVWVKAIIGGIESEFSRPQEGTPHVWETNIPPSSPPPNTPEIKDPVTRYFKGLGFVYVERTSLDKDKDASIYVRLDYSGKDNEAGVKVDLGEFYKRYRAEHGGQAPERIVLKFSDIDAATLENFTLGLLDRARTDKKAEDAAADDPHSAYVALKGAGTGELDWDNLATYGLALDRTAMTVTLDLKPRNIYVTRVMKDENNYITGGSPDSDDAVSFGVSGAGSKWAYLGLYRAAGVNYDRSGAFDFTLTGLPDGAAYRLVLGQEDEKDAQGKVTKKGDALVFEPRGPVGSVSLESFHEEYLSLFNGAAASVPGTGILQLTFPSSAAADKLPQVAVNDVARDEDRLPFDNYGAWYKNGYLKLNVKKTTGFHVGNFLNTVRFGLSLDDDSHGMADLSAYSMDDDSLRDNMIAAGCLEENTDFWMIKLPANAIKGGNFDQTELAGVFWESAAAGDYEILSIAVSANGASEHKLELPRVDRSQLFTKAGLLLQGDMAGLTLSNVCVNNQKFPARFLEAALPDAPDTPEDVPAGGVQGLVLELPTDTFVEYHVDFSGPIYPEQP